MNALIATKLFNLVVARKEDKDGRRVREASRGERNVGEKGVGCVVGTRVSLFAPDWYGVFCVYGEFMCVKARRNVVYIAFTKKKKKNGTEGVYLSGEFFFSFVSQLAEVIEKYGYAFTRLRNRDVIVNYG